MPIPFKGINKKTQTLRFFDFEDDALLPLSSLQHDNPLFQGILALENAIMQTGHGEMDSHLDYPSHDRHDKDWLVSDAERSKLALSHIRQLLDSPLNREGDFYKFWFDIQGTNYFLGNHVLLTAISRACHSMSQLHTDYVSEMVLMILHDAHLKLSPLYFKHFLSFRFIPVKGECQNVDYYYDNTPLTLAIVTGLHHVTDKILEFGLLSREDMNLRTGSGYVIKDLMGQISKENPMLLSAAHLAALRLSVTQLEEDLGSLMKLRTYGADFTLQDEYGKTVNELAEIEIPQFTQDSMLRRNDMLSSYAHRLEYDACFKDNYGVPDVYDPNSTPLVKYPDIFPPPLVNPSSDRRKVIHEALQSISDSKLSDLDASVDQGKMFEP